MHKMHVRPFLLTPVVVATMALGICVGGASAATLFTTDANTTDAAVGSTASATLSSPLIFAAATSQVNLCNTSTLVKAG